MIEKMILCILMKLYWFECVVVVYAVWKKIEGTIFFMCLCVCIGVASRGFERT
jgi:hypothetical protein